MNEGDDLQTVKRLAADQRGVFSLTDLRASLAEPHRAALYRRVDRLIARGVLRRFSSGFYVAGDFDLAVLCQRIAPDAALSFEFVLARELVIGPKPAHALSAIRSGRTQHIEGDGASLAFHHIKSDLRFGESVVAGVRSTDAEKAMLDVLLFHQRGRRALFDLRSDVHLDRLDRRKLGRYLRRYENPRFVAFARGVLELP